MSETSRTGAMRYSAVCETSRCDNEEVEQRGASRDEHHEKRATAVLPSWVVPFCIAHGLADCGKRSWAFGVGLLLLYINDNEDLRLTATLPLVSSTACVLLGSRIGSWVQSASLLRSAVVTLAVHHFGIVFAAASFVLSQHSSVAIILSSVVAQLGSLGSAIATEKRWAATLSHCCNSQPQPSFLSTCLAFGICSKLSLFQYGHVDSLHQEKETSSGNAAVGQETIAVEKEDTLGHSLEIESGVFCDDVLSCTTDNPGNNNKDQQSGRILARVNAAIRCIDLTCDLVAPMVVGFLLQYTSPTDTAFVIAVFNLVAWPMEVVCLLWIYKAHYTQIASLTEPVSVLELQNVSHQTESSILSEHVAEKSVGGIQPRVGDGNVLEETDTEQSYGAVAVVVEDADDDTDLVQSTHVRFYALRLYCRQPIFQSALALAVLNLTVLCMGTLMMAWLVLLGFQESYVGMARAFAAASGMLATQVSPRATQKHGIEGAAFRFILFMWLCLLPCAIIAPLAVGSGSHHGSAFSEQGLVLVWIMVVAVVLSRFGLWGFDLCVTQLLQERIDPLSALGSVNGTQAAIQSAFEALAALTCVLVPDPKRFSFLVVGSFGSVTVATLLHTCAHFRIQQKPGPAPS